MLFGVHIRLVKKNWVNESAKGGGIWGVFPPPPSELRPKLRMCESLSEDERQTNNAAELVPVIAALRALKPRFVRYV